MRSIDSADPLDWNPFQKFAFRYLFCYCFLFIFPFPFPFSSIPLVAYLTIPWNWFATNFVTLMTVYCFHRVPDLSGAATLTSADKEASTIVSSVSIVPITKGIFPEYRTRSLDENRLDTTAWSLVEYTKYEALGAQSEPLRLLLADQTNALATAVNGSNNNGIISSLRWRAADIPENVLNIEITGDNNDSLQRAAPASWQNTRNDFKNVSGNHAKTLDVMKLKKQYGENESKKFLENFSHLESEKGRPHEVWMFGLDDGNGDKSWIDALVLLKSKLKPFRYEVFALDHTPKRKFFTSLNSAQTFAQTLKPQAHAQIVEEGPATLALDKGAAVVAVTGKVSKRELDQNSKQRVAGLKQMMNFANMFPGTKVLRANAFDSGPRFQFVNYPINWFPPQAKIEQLENGGIKVSIPSRFSVCYAYHGAFAIKDYDQYRYMDALGLSAINYGMSNKEVENHLKQLDRAYGLAVISADYDGLTAKYLHLPTDLQSLFKQEKSFCPSLEEGQAMNELKTTGIVHYWWD